MEKNKLAYYFILLLVVIVIVSGCVPKFGSKGSSKSGKGIEISFLPNNPQDRYVVSDLDEEPISIILELRNKGAYPQEEDVNELSRGGAYISGFDRSIITIDGNSERISSDALMGVSSINPDGSFDTIEFKGSIFGEDINVDKYEPTILATLCYPYLTKASPTVCIDPFPFDESQEKVCKIGSQTLSGQGAPLAITSIDQEASSNKIQFKISLKNVGKGDIVDLNSLDSCNPSEGKLLERENFDRVQLMKATTGITALDCSSSTEGSGIIRLHDGEGFVICSIDKESYDDAKSAYTTTLNLELRYGYRTTASKSITISKIASS